MSVHEITPIAQTLHSRYGGSKMAVIIGCPGYLVATKDCKDVEGDAAKKGTAAHNAAEFCLKYRIMDAVNIIGSEFYGHTVDEEMAEGINIYLQYIRGLMLKHPNATMHIEPKVTMSSVAHVDNNVFGYIDCLIMVLDEGVLYVIDFKFGMVVVDVKDNSQIAHYSVSALDTYNLWFRVNKVVGVIVQPRKEHSDGLVRSTEFSIKDLMKWRDVIVDAIRKSKEPDPMRIAGTHCHYCPKRGECRARMLYTVTLSTTLKPNGDMTDDEIAVVLENIPSMIKNIEAMKEHALSISRGGTIPTGYKLVRASAKAVCSDPDKFVNEMAAVNPAFKKEDSYWPGNMKGKTELKKKRSKEEIEIINKYFPTPDANTQLVPLSNPKSAINTDASQAFKGVIL